VIEGPKAGGHLGYSREDIKRYEHQGYEEEIQKILSVVRTFEEKFNKKSPSFLGVACLTKMTSPAICR
ncbi:MAG: hypothetical protein E6293_04110, partial [Dialister sp.]|nr:hypothetical protein [Dialister sp.]